MKEKKGMMPPNARYPIFLAGLLVLIGFGLLGVKQHFSSSVDVIIVAVGFVLLMISIAAR